MEASSFFRGILLLLWVFSMYPQESYAFQWTQSLKNGSTVHHCVGDDVTFRWSYVTDKGEDVLAVFLYSQRNGTLVTRFLGREMTSSRRVTFLPDAGMTLSEVTSGDAGLYGIHVKLYRGSVVYTQVVNLFVSEPPKLVGNRLEVSHLVSDAGVSGSNNNNNNSNNSNNNKTCGSSAGKLCCGRFISLGVPPVSIVWTDPDMQDHKSSANDSGHFLFDLPPSHKGGDYECSLILQPEASKCLPDDSSLITSASIFLETTETKVEEQAEDLEDLKQELQQIRTDTSELKKSQSSVFMEEMGGRLQNLEDKAENLTQELENHGWANRLLAASSIKLSNELGMSFRRSVKQSEERTKQTIQANIKNLSEQLEEATTIINNQKAASSAHESSIKALQQQLQTIQNKLLDQNDLKTQLQSELASTKITLDQQKSMIDDLQDKIHEQREENERQKQINTDQKVAMTALQTAQRRLVNNVHNSTHVSQLLAEMEAKLTEAIGQAGNSSSQAGVAMFESLALDVVALQQNASLTRNQYDALVPRVTALEDGMDDVSEKLNKDNTPHSTINTPTSPSPTTQLLIVTTPPPTLPSYLTRPLWPPDPIRLVDGSNPREGRVEIRIGNRWGTVCDDEWGPNDAKVVCAMLGYLGPGAEARTSAFFGQGSGPIVLDDVNCTGKEPSLQMCGARAFGTHNCQHSEDAGVVCPQN